MNNLQNHSLRASAVGFSAALWVLLVALSISSGQAQAAGWTAPLTVSHAFTEESDLIVVYTTDGLGQWTPGCSAHTWIFRASTDARRGRAWATVLAALASGQKIAFWYTDSCGTWGYHNATSIMLFKP
jgi:hypothetical protein